MKVLLPIDGSKASDMTLDWLSSFLDKGSARLHLLHVVDSTYASAELDLLQGNVNKLLDKAAQKLEKEGFSVESSTYVVGNPAEEICQYADTHDILMIILGSKGRTGLGRLLLGSVSTEVFEKSRQQVLVLNNTTARPSLTMPLNRPD